MKAIDTSSEISALELKGSVLTIMVLHIKDTDPDLLYPQLEKKIRPARSFFNNAPVLIDLHALDEEKQDALDFVLLADTLRGLGLIPVAVRGGAASQSGGVLRAGMGLLPTTRAERTISVDIDKPPAEPEPSNEKEQTASSDTVEIQEPVVASTKVITQPVRSGQQVFAPQGDLVILSSVNAGAEVLAAGNIHVYGALRGRAMAGINGDVTARIFSLQCNPELVAVAGEYMVNEYLNKSIINQSIMIFLKDGGLKFASLGTFSPLL